MGLRYTVVNGVDIPLCVRCRTPVKKSGEVNRGDKPPARIICRKCYGDAKCQPDARC